eukprot:COSAG04_NODE_968_length_9110_cov_6.799911_11_plen_214_part_00
MLTLDSGQGAVTDDHVGLVVTSDVGGAIPAGTTLLSVNGLELTWKNYALGAAEKYTLYTSPPARPDANNGPGVVVVHKNAHQLPLFVIHFRVNPAPHPAAGAPMAAAAPMPMPAPMPAQQMHQALMGGGVPPAWGRQPWRQPAGQQAQAPRANAAPFAGLGAGRTLGSGPGDPSPCTWDVERRGEFSPLGPRARCFLALGSGLGLVGTASPGR